MAAPGWLLSWVEIEPTQGFEHLCLVIAGKILAIGIGSGSDSRQNETNLLIRDPLRIDRFARTGDDGAEDLRGDAVPSGGFLRQHMPHHQQRGLHRAAALDNVMRNAREDEARKASHRLRLHGLINSVN